MKNNIPKSLELILSKDEGKTIEFKEKFSSSRNLVRTAIAFANTAGGKIVIGIKDKTKDIIGVKNITQEEERIINIISDSISPKLIPQISSISWRGRNILIVDIPYLAKPFYEISKGSDEGVYLRFGSTNRKVGPEIISEIERHAINKSFDEQVCMDVNSEAIDFRAASELFKRVAKTLDKSKIKTLGLLTNYQGNEYPTNGAVLLFGDNRSAIHSDTGIRCVRFAGNTKTKIIDQEEIDSFLPIAVNDAISFIEKNTRIGLKITSPQHTITYEYPEWKTVLIQYLQKNNSISTRDAAELWKITDRAARSRLKKLLDQNTLSELGTGPKDPQRVYLERK